MLLDRILRDSHNAMPLSRHPGTINGYDDVNSGMGRNLARSHATETGDKHQSERLISCRLQLYRLKQKLK